MSRVRFGPTISTMVFAHQVTSRRLTLTYNGTQPVLAINGTVLATGAAYGATPSWTVSEPPRATNGWSRTRATAESMSSARNTE